LILFNELLRIFVKQNWLMCGPFNQLQT